MLAKTLLIGVGNTLRGDDGLGAFVCRHFEKKGRVNIGVMVVHQLDTTLLPALKAFNRIIIVDAAIGLHEVVIKKLENNLADTNPLTHELSANSFALLSKKLFDNSAVFYTCEIPADNFDVNDSISPAALAHAREAIAKIEQYFFEATA